MSTSTFPAFSPEETKVVGTFPNSPEDAFYFPGFETEKYNTPITPRENYLRFLNREPICWVPDLILDSNLISSMRLPDNRAESSQGGIDGLGAKWIPDVSHPELPAMVDTNYLLDEITEWENIQWPDIDSWDWEQIAKDYDSVLDPDRLRAIWLVCGLNERLASVVGFSEGLASYLAEPEAVHEFFDRLLEYNLDMIEHYHKYLHPDLIEFSDDWGTQKAPFVSPAVAEEFFVPHVKKLVERTHELGMKFMLHSCGNITSLVPLMIDAGIDQWEVNYEAVKDTLDETIEKYGDKILFDIYLGARDPLPENDDEFKAYVDKTIKQYCGSGVSTMSYQDSQERSFNSRAYCYEMARKTALALDR